jgi:hypothetical protein
LKVFENGVMMRICEREKEEVEHRLRVLENRVQRRKFGPKWE